MSIPFYSDIDMKNNKITNAEIQGNLDGNATTATAASYCSGVAEKAVKLAETRTISLSGDVSGSVNFNGSGSVVMPTSVSSNVNLKNLVNYLYWVTYIDNARVLATLQCIANESTNKYVSTTSDSPYYAGDYIAQIDNLCMRDVKYLAYLLPTSNSYKSILNNIINTMWTGMTYTSAADLIVSQRLVILRTGEGSSSIPTFAIKNNNYSVPNVISQLRASL